MLKQDSPWLGEVVRAKKPAHLPVVLSIQEVQKTLSLLEGEVGLVTQLLYGAGLRLMEALRLRVKDVDFSRNELLIRDGKGQKDRVTVLPVSVIEPLRRHVARVRVLHHRHWPMAGEMSIYRMRWPASTPRRLGNGLGNTCSRQRVSPWIHAAGPCGVII